MKERNVPFLLFPLDFGGAIAFTVRGLFELEEEDLLLYRNGLLKEELEGKEGRKEEVRFGFR